MKGPNNKHIYMQCIELRTEDSAVCSGAAAPAVGALALIDSINSDAEDDIVVRRLLDAWMTR